MLTEADELRPSVHPSQAISQFSLQLYGDMRTGEEINVVSLLTPWSAPARGRNYDIAYCNRGYMAGMPGKIRRILKYKANLISIHMQFICKMF